MIIIIIIMIIIVIITILLKRPKRSACWDLHESSGRCLMYDQNE